VADSQRAAETTAKSDVTADHTAEDTDATPEEGPSNASVITKTINGYAY
jgi:hypothetical protein